MALGSPARAQGQAFTWTPEQLLKYTAQNPYERFPDGRPKVPNSILERVRELSAEEVLGVTSRGYPSQFVDGLQVLRPGKKLVASPPSVVFPKPTTSDRHAARGPRTP
jgi:hypothetical protein